MLIAAGLLVTVALVLALAFAGRPRRDVRAALAALDAGLPRRSRALARLAQRDADEVERRWAAYQEAVAIFWQGDFERALARLDPLERAFPGAVALTVLRIECLVFEDRVSEARTIFATHADAIRRHQSRGYSEGVLVEGLLAFHEGELDAAAMSFEALAHGDRKNALSHIVEFYLAAIATRRGRPTDAEKHLMRVIEGGGALFIVDWALLAWEPRHGNARRPPVRARRPPHALRSLARTIGRGAQLLLFRRAALQGRFTHGDVAIAIVFDVVLVFGLRLLAFERDAIFVTYTIGELLAATLLLLPLAYFGASALRIRRHTIDLAGLYYGALPVFVVASFIASELHTRHGVLWKVVIVAEAAWLATAMLFATRRLAPSSPAVVRLLVALAICAAWIVPSYQTRSSRLWFARPPTPPAEDTVDIGAFALDQADKLRAKEDEIAAGRPNHDDLYFIGFAGYDDPVFRHEVVYAKTLFDDRYATRGRSLVLVNDLATRDDVPMALRASLAHAIKAMGSKMNLEEDVLFLFLTSHGSRAGLGISAAHAPDEFGDDLLTPQQLRGALDAAGIQWRVVIVSGCMSGGFVEALANEHTFVATASATDRASFGCAPGNDFTEYGRAVFADQLAHECSFATAFSNANELIAKRESERRQKPSLPKLAVGAAIEPKLRAMTCQPVKD